MILYIASVIYDVSVHVYLRGLFYRLTFLIKKWILEQICYGALVDFALAFKVQK